jgi:hypothetical protein
MMIFIFLTSCLSAEQICDSKYNGASVRVFIKDDIVEIVYAGANKFRIEFGKDRFEKYLRCVTAGFSPEESIELEPVFSRSLGAVEIEGEWKDYNSLKIGFDVED